MNTRMLRWAALATAGLLSLPALTAGQSFVSENQYEFYTAGDFDNDGRPDVVLVDKATGAYRIGYQTAAGTHNWVPSRASGVENVTGLAIGTLLNSASAAMAFTSPEANRVNLLQAADQAVAGLPIPIPIPAVGPVLVTALDIGGANNTSNDDLFVGSIWNGESSVANRATLVRDTNGPNYTILANVPLAGWPARGNRIVLRHGFHDFLGLMLRGDTQDTFQTYDLATGVCVRASAVANLPSGCDYVFANFSSSALSQYLFYQPGDTNLMSWQVDEPDTDTFAFRFQTTFLLSQPVRQVFVVPGAGQPNLLLVAADGQSATVCEYDGTNQLTLLTNLTAGPGETFTGAVPLGSSGFLTFSCTDGSGRSSGFRTYKSAGRGYTLSASGSLAALTPFSARGNVLQFQGEPFVSSRPVLVRSLNAGDWSSVLSLAGGVVSVRQEWYRSPSLGLGNGNAISLGPIHPLASDGLANQYQDTISLFSLGPASGDENCDVQITPLPGRYQTSVNISFLPPTSTYELRYRLGTASAWQVYPLANPTSRPIWLFGNTTVYYYTQSPSGAAKSRIRTTSYTFTEGPATLDSDKDGVPDYVEIVHGLDPVNSGSDGDGDGFSDKEELIAHTDPIDPTHFPAASRRLEERAAMDWFCTPHPWDAFSGAPTFCRGDVAIRVYGQAGGFLGRGEIESDANPSAFFTNLICGREDRLLQMATSPHYEIQTASPDKGLGREMLRLLVPPPLPSVTVPYDYAGGDPAIEAAAWVAAAVVAFANVQHVTVQGTQGDLTVDDTLAALLVERKIGQILEARGTNWTTNLTLFPWRTGDLVRSNLSQGLLLSLETSAGTQPGYRLASICQTLDAAVRTSTDSGLLSLKVVTREIYRICGASNNVAPGAYPLPVDVLRSFLLDGTIQSNYLAATVVPASTWRSASNGVRTILGLASSRPIATLALQTRPDSFTGACTVMETPATPAVPHNLFLAGGDPWRLPTAFGLPPGSQLEVSGYADASSPNCPGPGLEVISVRLLSVPGANWDPNSCSPILITLLDSQTARLEWSFDPRYASQFTFTILASAFAAGPYAVLRADVQPDASGRFLETLDLTGMDGRFYRVTWAPRTP